MKTYTGHGHRPEVGGPGDVYVTENGVTKPLEHRVRHSPDGFSWGYGGSGPAELARCLLWDALGEEPLPWLYQRFKAEHVATWPMEERVCWKLTDVDILKWCDLAAKRKEWALSR